jgi:hypothetical protein
LLKFPALADSLPLCDLEELSQIAQAISPSETILLCGSILTNLSAKESSPDLLILGANIRARPTRAASLNGSRVARYRLSSGAIVNVHYADVEDLAALKTVSSHFMDGLSLPSVLLNPPEFLLREQILMHEISTGVPLANASISQMWRENLAIDFLATFISVYRLGRCNARCRNAISFAAVNEWQSAHWCLREAYEELLCAYLASHGHTNPRRRWHLELLDLVASAGDRSACTLKEILLCAIHGLDDRDFKERLHFADVLKNSIITRFPALEILNDSMYREFYTNHI